MDDRRAGLRGRDRRVRNLLRRNRQMRWHRRRMNRAGVGAGPDHRSHVHPTLSHARSSSRANSLPNRGLDSRVVRLLRCPRTYHCTIRNGAESPQAAGLLLDAHDTWSKEIDSTDTGIEDGQGFNAGGNVRNYNLSDPKRDPRGAALLMQLSVAEEP